MFSKFVPKITASEERIIFGQAFREARKKAELTQRDITILKGFAQAYICDVETGKSSISVDHMAELAHLVDVPLWRLLKPRS